MASNSGSFEQGIYTGMGSALGTLIVAVLLLWLFGRSANAAGAGVDPQTYDAGGCGCA